MNVLVFNLKTDAEDGVLGFTTDWVNALAERCGKVVVITMAMGTLRVAPNVTVHSIGLEKGYSRPRRLLIFYALLWKVLRRERIDVCFAHMNALFALLGAPLLKAFGVPILMWYAHKSVTATLRAAEKVVDAAVTSSASGFQLASKKLTVIGQGIDTNRFVPAATPPDPEAPLRFLSFGRISRVKRLEIILHALARLKASEPAIAFRCRIAGDPLDQDGRTYLAELRELAASLGLEKEVEFEPGVPFHQAQRFFAEADLFLNPGDTDSVDKTGLEAMSCEVPMITSNIAFREILPADMHPNTIVPKNQPEKFAAAIASFAAWPPEQRRAFGRRCRSVVVSGHSIESLADKLISAMRALADRNKRR